MKIYLVGGAVRDKLLGLPVIERDYVVVGATIASMLALGFRQVGKDFPVFLHPKTQEEYALARRERKVLPGYKGFTFDTSQDVTLEDDLSRRDLTINAMAMDLDTEEIIDPHHGAADIQHKTLRHVSSAFSEDPVRILRVSRFYARYGHLGFRVDPTTLELMRQMVKSGEINALVSERVWKELERALRENNPEYFFEILAQIEALPILFPHLTQRGFGLSALQKAAHYSKESAIRLAALLHDLPEDQLDKKNTKKILQTLCDRYRIPNQHRELALLSALHHQTTLQAQNLSPLQLNQLFSQLDIYRREKRFLNFLTVLQAIAFAHHQPFDAEWLTQCAAQAKMVDVQALIAQGLSGMKLAQELKEKRQEAIKAWLETH